MKFSKFSNYLEKLEATPKRLEITAILSKLITELNVDEVEKAIYLSLGYLKAPFEKSKFNIADKMMLKILSTAYDKEIKEVLNVYEKLGDLGDTALELKMNKSSNDPEILAVYKTLLDIAKTQGSGSQEAKINKSANLLLSVDGISAKYIIRIILGTTRLGFTELTIMDALSDYLKSNKSDRVKIEEKYNMHPDIGLIAKYIKKGGLKELDSIEMETGVPVLSQKPQRLTGMKEIMEKMDGTAWAEYKLDGTRVQLHLDRNKVIPSKSGSGGLFKEDNKHIFVKTFTRNLEETTHQFPDIIKAAKKQIKATSVILDGEAIGYDKKTGKFLPFQEVIKRKRKYDVSDMAKEIPLKYYVFDILYLNGKSTMNMPLTDRRELLEKVVQGGETIELGQYLITQDPKELKNYYEGAKKKGLEGLVIKNPQSNYQAGARSFAWIKLKKGENEILADDFDCVILGYYFGKGFRSDFGVGGFLAGVYDKKEDVFKTITKVGTGLKDEDWKELKIKCDKIAVAGKPKNLRVKKELYPDVWTKPNIVVTLKADEITKSPNHTSGYALRFPRFINYREDKSAVETTNIDEIKNLHKDQKRGYY